MGSYTCPIPLCRELRHDRGRHVRHIKCTNAQSNPTGMLDHASSFGGASWRAYRPTKQCSKNPFVVSTKCS
eukprot:507800-Pyramimonas_sp.AAC.1